MEFSKKSRMAWAGSCWVLAASCLTCGSASGAELTGDLSQIGSMTFGAGILPPPGVTTFASRVVVEDINKIADSNGNLQSPLKSVSSTTEAIAGILTHMTDWRLFGADYGMQIVLPYVNSTSSSTIAAGPRTIQSQGRFSELVNVTVSPIMLQWRDPDNRFNQNFVLDTQIPAGNYQAGNPLNAATDAYAIRPKYTFTYLSKSGFETTASTSVEYDFANQHENYHTGIVGAFNFALGQHVGPFTLGVSGYALKQFTGDQINGTLAPNGGNKAQVFALGPAVTYRDSSNPRSFFVSLKFMHEFGAKNRTEGNGVWFILGHPI